MIQTTYEALYPTSRAIAVYLKNRRQAGTRSGANKAGEGGKREGEGKKAGCESKMP